jgi:uncharacterized membrane protein YcaP (DUF421 family)
MFFDSLYGLARVSVVGIAVYGALILVLRLSGKRTLAKLNAFDLVVTVALGSTLASAFLSKDVALAEGVLGLVVLVTLQFVIAWMSVRWRPLASLVRAEPVVLAWEGRLLDGELRRERVAPDEVRQALRQHGIGSLEQVAAVVLETDGSISVLSSAGRGPGSSLAGVRNAAAERPGNA